MNSGFDATALERDYAFLDKCPKQFLVTAITLPFGDLHERVHGTRVWHDALLGGQLPSVHTWPPEEIAAPVRQALDKLKIVWFCKDYPELADALLQDILEAFASQNEAFQADIAKRLHELKKELELLDQAKREVTIKRATADGLLADWEKKGNIWDELGYVDYRSNALLQDILEGRLRRYETYDPEAFQADIAKRLRDLKEPERVQASKRKNPESKRKNPASKRKNPESKQAQSSNEALRRLSNQAKREISAKARGADAALFKTWEQKASDWAEIASAFGDLGQMTGSGWGLSLGVLRHTGWNKTAKLRQLVKRIPEFRKIVQALGRLHVSETEQTAAKKVFAPMRRLDTEWLETPTPSVPEETRGVELSDAIARMLPVEAAMLGHPKLRLLWHARRSEQALITYRVEGVDLEKNTGEREATEKGDVQSPRREQGPIIAIVDTSGSMQGPPLQIAKALILEALRTAHAEKRRCYLYTFSGPGQIAEHELDMSPEGIGRLLDFLGLRLTFGGGTDPRQPMTKILSKLRDKEWTKADVLFVSDGEWPAPSGVAEDIRKARKAGTRFHGVQLGKRGRTGLHDLCEPVHVFSSWIDITDRSKDTSENSEFVWELFGNSR